MSKLNYKDEEIKMIIEAIEQHDVEWIREFIKLIEVMKDLSHDQVMALIEMLKA